MDKNTIIGLLLIFALFLGFSFYNTSKNKKLKEKEYEKLLDETADRLVANDTAMVALDSLQPNNNVSSQQPQSQQQQAAPVAHHAAFSSPELADESDYVVETDKAVYHFAKKGGYIKTVELKGVYRYTPKDSAKQPLIMYDGTTNDMNIDLMLKDQSVVKTKDLFFLAKNDDTLFVTDNGSKQLSLRLYPNKTHIDSLDEQCEMLDYNSYVEYLYTFNSEDYRFGYTVNFVNMEQYLYPNQHNFTLQWEADLKCEEKNYTYARDITTLFYMDNLKKVSNLDERASDKKDSPSPIRWVSFKQQFFTSTIIADKSEFSTATMTVTTPDKNEKSILKSMTADLDFNVSDINKGSYDMSLYFGPNQYKLLKQYDLNLERQVPLGWGFFLLHWVNRFVIIPIFNWLEAYGINYGIIILILTIFIKTVLFPVAYKTYKSSARMRVLKPEIDQINARYPKQDDAMKKQQATMNLYKSAGINPMSGCLPMLLQMPILIAMFRFFPSAYELRQQPFLWADDLSTYDSILNFGFSIPFYGDHVSLFTLLMTVSTLIYTWLNNKLMSPGAGDQQKMMKVMMYIMPILFLGMFNSFSSALTYYYLLVNLITFVQMAFFRYAINENKLRESLKIKMSKPVKKSKWQLKMEEVAKQQAQLQKRK